MFDSFAYSLLHLSVCSYICHLCGLFQVSEARATRGTLLLMILVLLLSRAVTCIVDHCQLQAPLLHLSPQQPPTIARYLNLPALVTASVYSLGRSATSTWIVLMALMKDLAVSDTTYFVLEA